jgi:hypothetical protein
MHLNYTVFYLLVSNDSALAELLHFIDLPFSGRNLGVTFSCLFDMIISAHGIPLFFLKNSFVILKSHMFPGEKFRIFG